MANVCEINEILSFKDIIMAARTRCDDPIFPSDVSHIDGEFPQLTSDG